MVISVERLRSLLHVTETSMDLAASVAEDHGDHVVERLRFRLPDGIEIRGFLTRPTENLALGPAILYAHAHGGRYDIGAGELIAGRRCPPRCPWAALGARRLCHAVHRHADLRRACRRNGKRRRESGAVARQDFVRADARRAGRSLELACIAHRRRCRSHRHDRDFDGRHAHLLSGGDRQPRGRAAHLCCYADVATLVETGAHDLHGHYLTIPGLLSETSTGEIAGLPSSMPLGRTWRAQAMSRCASTCRPSASVQT